MAEQLLSHSPAPVSLGLVCYTCMLVALELIIVLAYYSGSVYSSSMEYKSDKNYASKSERLLFVPKGKIVHTTRNE